MNQYLFIFFYRQQIGWTKRGENEWRRKKKLRKLPLFLLNHAMNKNLKMKDKNWFSKIVNKIGMKQREERKKLSRKSEKKRNEQFEMIFNHFKLPVKRVEKKDESKK